MNGGPRQTDAYAAGDANYSGRRCLTATGRDGRDALAASPPTGAPGDYERRVPDTTGAVAGDIDCGGGSTARSRSGSWVSARGDGLPYPSACLEVPPPT